MKDAIGQEINVGDTVVHTGGRYAAASDKIYPVFKINQHKVTVEDKHWGCFSVWPDTLIVVTMNLKALGK